MHAQEAERQRVALGKAAEMPSSVVMTGMLRLLGEAASSSSQAPESSTPWPAMMTGRWACSIRRAALRIWRMLRLERGLDSRAGRRRSGSREFGLGQQDVLRHVDVDRAGPAGAGEVEGLLA